MTMNTVDVKKTTSSNDNSVYHVTKILLFVWYEHVITKNRKMDPTAELSKYNQQFAIAHGFQPRQLPAIVHID